MELRHFRCFLAVARSLHFSRAAAELGISPPALSKQIQETERFLGARLFLRTKRSVALTAAGEVFVGEAQRAMQQIGQAQEAARRAGRGELGRVAVGYVASAVYAGVLQEQIAAFRDSYPGLQVDAHEYPMQQLPFMLDQGRIDLAFLRPPLFYPEGVVSTVVLRDRFVIAVPAASALAQLEVIATRQLGNQNFIVPEQENGTLEIGRRGRFSPRIVDRPGSLVSVLSAVSLGVGCAVVPHSVVASINIPGVSYREVAGKMIASEIAVAYRRFEKAPAVQAFITRLQALVPA